MSGNIPMTIPEILFFGSLALVLHSYAGYPASLYLIGLFRNTRVRKGGDLPEVTLVITAHNEEKRIGAKLENTLALRYPRERLQVIVASDGSTDGTNAAVSAHREEGIELLALRERGGKESAQKAAVTAARGDILVFTDVATMLDPWGLERIVSGFADPTVGCVSSEDRLIGKDGRPSGEGLYVRYEMGLRRLESRVNSLVGLSGSFFAARKAVCRDFSEDMQSDFRTLLNSVKMGLRGINEPEAVGYYRDISNRGREFDRKVRTVLRGLTVFFRHAELLNVFRYGLFSYQFFCHKLLRWLVPLFLAVLFASNAVLAAHSSGYLLLLGGQAAFYGLAAWGLAGSRGAAGRITKVPAYFLTVNASIFVAWWRFLRRQRIVMWNPSER
jgi:cellulose synthase/poly-beta-1,6-N-acetylglucosamine synthase-like glycosyltransferase